MTKWILFLCAFAIQSFAFGATHIDSDKYNQIRFIPRNQKSTTDHDLIALMSVKGFHKLEVALYHMNADNSVASIEMNYKIQKGDFKAVDAPRCPDKSTQFIAFAPNDDDLEQRVTVEVATEAIAKGLKTVQLLKADATKQNYLNYMVCPKLVGNFYDGDSNPNEFVTVDGTITSDEVTSILPKAFRYKVTNIWLACEAYNDPMFTAVTGDAQAQKYAAGINDLQVGPSDEAGACAMEAAIDGQPMTQAFADCYKAKDNVDDHWGFGGNGSDLFGH